MMEKTCCPLVSHFDYTPREASYSPLSANMTSSRKLEVCTVVRELNHSHS